MSLTMKDSKLLRLLNDEQVKDHRHMAGLGYKLLGWTADPKRVYAMYGKQLSTRRVVVLYRSYGPTLYYEPIKRPACEPDYA